MPGRHEPAIGPAFCYPVVSSGQIQMHFNLLSPFVQFYVENAATNDHSMIR